MIERFRLGVRELSSMYESILPGELMWFLGSIAEKPKEEFLFPDKVWTEIIYSFAVASHKRLMSQGHIVKALTPLYLGKVASFVIETWESSADEVEHRLEDLCLAFENGKEYLIDRWFEDMDK